MSERLNDIVVGVFNDWFLSQHGLLPEQAITRIAELEAKLKDRLEELEEIKDQVEIMLESNIMLDCSLTNALRDMLKQEQSDE